MLVVDLACPHGHAFEGWFASADDLASQRARGLVACPVCGDTDVQRRPSATRLNVSGAVEPKPNHVAQQSAVSHGGAPVEADVVQMRAMLDGVQKQWLQAVRHVVENTEDVGTHFADEARKIHHGDAPERGIRGQASPEDKQALQDEGIDVLTMPMPDAFKGTLQ
jgi:hypothetical protein